MNGKKKFLIFVFVLSLLCFLVSTTIATDMMKSTNPTMYWLGVMSVISPLVFAVATVILWVTTNNKGK